MFQAVLDVIHETVKAMSRQQYRDFLDWLGSEIEIREMACKEEDAQEEET